MAQVFVGHYPIFNLQYASDSLEDSSQCQESSSTSNENMDIEGDESTFENFDIEDGNDDECSYGLKLVRNPTFFPVSSKSPNLSEHFSKLCENCDTSDDEDSENSNCDVEEITRSSSVLERNQSRIEKRKNCVNKQIQTSPAVIFCKDCRLSMCRKCCECHGIMRKNRKHEVVPILNSDETVKTFIKKSVRNRKKRNFLKHGDKIRRTRAKTHRPEKPPIPELSTEDCLESNVLQTEIDKTIFGLNRRIDHLQSKLDQWDQVIDEFHQNMLHTQISIVETGEKIRRKVEAQMEFMLDKINSEALKFCSHIEDKKGELVDSVMTLAKSRTWLFDLKEKGQFTRDERKNLIGMLKDITTQQNEVMSKRVEIQSKLGIVFKPTEPELACPSVGSLDITNVDLGIGSLSCLSSNLVHTVPFDNEVRGLTALRKHLAVVTANSPTVFLLSLDTLEHESSFNVKDLKNPYDLISDQSEALYITEWSATPCGSILATCRFKNKVAEFKNKKIEGKAVQFSKGNLKNTIGRINNYNQNNSEFDDAASQNGTLSGNACHTLAFTPQCSSDEQVYNYLFCTTDNQLFLVDDKGTPIQTYKRNQHGTAGDAHCQGRARPNSVSSNISQALNGPSHLAMDREGLVYVCDSGNDRVIMLDGCLNFIKEILPPGLGGIRNPLRISLDTDRSRLFVAATSLYIFDLF